MATCCTSLLPKVSLVLVLHLHSIALSSFGIVFCLLFVRIFSYVIYTVHAAVSANTFAIYGAGQVKELTELVPGILNQLGPDSLASLRKLAESYQAIQQNQQRPPNAAADEDDDDVPDLVENFDVVEDKPKEESQLEELN